MFTARYALSPYITQIRLVFKRLTLCINAQQNATDPHAGYPDRLGPSDTFVENSTKLSCLEITGYRINHSTVLWLLELQIRRFRKV
jgi:hypothetical protein